MTGHLPIALTCGDPAGIGPELAASAWQALKNELPFFLIGSASHLPDGTQTIAIDHPSEALAAMDKGLPVLDHPFPGSDPIPGQPNPDHAQPIIQAIDRAVTLVTGGQAAALTTAPIAKQVLIDGAGFAFPGHTEFLAHLTGADRAVMMLVGGGLRVVPATIHIPLADVPKALTPALLRQTLRILDRALRELFGIATPTIAVAGLNPHAGEGGKIGTEEQDWITACLEEARQEEGLTLTGPLPADTMFHETARARYDAALTMYHDQGLIPIKTLAFDSGVNLTLGLPIIRTSPDHGTAFDIAGTGRANPASLIEALRLAHRLSQKK